MTTTTDDSMLTMTRIRGMARDVTAIAAVLGWTMPKPVVAAADLAAAARKLAAGISTGPLSTPTKGSALGAWVEQEAHRQLVEERQRAVAEQLTERLERESMRLTLETTPAVLDALIEKFAQAVEDFTSAAAGAPSEVTGHTTAEEFARYSAVLQATEALTIAAANRSRLSEVLMEGDAIRSPLWMLMEPQDGASLAEVDGLIFDLQRQIPTTREQWARLVRIGAVMAAPGVTEARMARHAQAHWNSGMSADGGLRDKTYAEAISAPAGTAHRASQMGSVE